MKRRAPSPVPAPAEFAAEPPAELPVDIGDFSDLRLDVASAPRGPRGLVVAGLVGACLLGAGLGLWARPAAEERRLTPRPTYGSPTAHQLQIEVDQSLLLPGTAPDAAAETPPEREMPAAPAPPSRPTGLMKVVATAPLAEPPMLDIRPLTPPKAKPKVEKPKPSNERSKVARKPKGATTGPAKAKAKEPAKVEKAVKKTPKAEMAEAKKTGRLEKVAKKVSNPIARGVKAEVAKAKTAKAARRAELARAEATKAEKAQLAKARLDRARGQRIAEANKAVTARRLAEARIKPAPSTLRMTTTVSRVDRCLNRDPGAALVCADPDLGAEDRRMTRAYRNAEAAGVSTTELQRQHRRWLAARTTAAREVPWAVKEVYQARIAELDDQTREAGAEY